MVRRALFVASMVLLLWAAPASAQSYGDILGQAPGGTQVVISSTGGTQVFTATAETQEVGGLARTGQDNVVPMVQAAIVLIGGGMLLLLVARRRHAVRRVTA